MYAGYQSLTDIPKVVQINEEYHDYAKEYENTPTHEILEVLYIMILPRRISENMPILDNIL